MVSLSLCAALASSACAAPSSTLEAEAPGEAPGDGSPTSASETRQASPTDDPAAAMHPTLDRYIRALEPELAALPAERRELLEQLATFIRARRDAGETAELIFICTHNSRRSHMGQLWAATAAAWYGVEGVATYSGGTEATAFNPRAVAALQRAGFEIAAPDPGPADNPRYQVSYGPEGPTMIAFSKTWQDGQNPDQGFAAIMTCTQADEACPFVRGAKLRLSLPYDDPKAADGTAEEAARYDERARQIAAEMFYLFGQLAE